MALAMIGLLAVCWVFVEGLPALLAPGYSLYQVVWMRYAVHLLFMLLVLGPRQGWGLLRTDRPLLQVGRGLLMLAMPVCFIEALNVIKVGNLLAVFWVAPLLVLALAAVIERDRAALLTWLAAAAALAGVTMILRPNGSFPPAGLLLALGMAGSYALYVVLTRTLRSDHTHTNLFYTAACVFVPLTAVMPLVWKQPAPMDLLVMGAVGLVGLALLWALDRATALAPVSWIAPFLLLPPVAGLAVDTLRLRDLPGRLALAGAALVLGSLALLLLLDATGLHTSPATAGVAGAENPVGHP